MFALVTKACFQNTSILPLKAVVEHDICVGGWMRNEECHMMLDMVIALTNHINITLFLLSLSVF